MIMTLSMRKIVESRNRRGGASLHRNLLVAGVLFKARDVLLAESAVIAAADHLDKSPATDDCVANVDGDRKSGSDDEMECELTVADTASLSRPLDDVSSRLGGKENVPPSVVTPDHPRCDDIPPSTDKTRALKRLSRDVVDDDVTPCKTTRDDTSVGHCDHRLTEAGMDAADKDSDVTCSAVNGEVCRPISCPSVAVSPSSSYRPAVAPSVVRRSNNVGRLSYFDSCLTQNVADPPLVRPLLVVQVV